MNLHYVDWVIILVYCVASFMAAAYFSKRAGTNIKEFFVAGGQLPWWLAGTSMVATTFAVDTPLAISAFVRKGGIYENWYWWCAVSGGVLMVFFYARLWRRAALITDVEFNELRYDGRSAAILRGGLAFYGAVGANSVVLGWVLVAMLKICGALFDLSAVDTAMGRITGVEWEWGKTLIIISLTLFTLIYSSMSGIWGVVVTDFIQFVFAMSGSIALAGIVLWKAGGPFGMVEQIRETPAYNPHVFNFVPDWNTAGKLVLITFAIQFVFQGWFSGQGGGYIVQRLFSTRNERHSAQACLWFYFAHIVLRSWPWIIVGLASLIYFPLSKGEDAEMIYPKMIVRFLPIGVRGLMVASLLAAFMSTVSTQLNWAASYFVTDLYRRFIVKNGTERHYVKAARVSTLIIMALGAIAAWQFDSIIGAWIYLGVLMAGGGLVGLFRWFWWRINAWSEISALVASLIFANGNLFARLFVWLGLLSPAQMTTIDWFYGDNTYAIRIVFLVAICTLISAVVTYMTKPVSTEHLEEFYRRVRPGGWWGPIAKRCPDVQVEPMRKGWIGVLYGIITIYAGLFGVGYICIARPWLGCVCLIVAAFACYLTLSQVPASEGTSQ